MQILLLAGKILVLDGDHQVAMDLLLSQQFQIITIIVKKIPKNQRNQKNQKNQNNQKNQKKQQNRKNARNQQLQLNQFVRQRGI